MGRRFVVHRLPTHQSLNVFLPARVVQEVVRERGSVVGTAVFAAWGVAVNGVCGRGAAFFPRGEMRRRGGLDGHTCCNDCGH